METIETVCKALEKLIAALDEDEEHSEFGQSLIVREAYEEARSVLERVKSHRSRALCTCHNLTADKCPSWNAR